MKNLIGLILILISSLAWAGGYYRPNIDVYDQETGLYYKSIYQKVGGGFMSSGDSLITNINVYSPETKESKVLFDSNDGFRVLSFIFEQAIEDGVVRFGNEGYGPIRNNTKVEARNPKNKILVVIDYEKSKITKLYTFKKDGTDKRLIGQFNSGSNWHVDARNSILRVVTQKNQKIQIEEFPW